jgi:hypothetical protein
VAISKIGLSIASNRLYYFKNIGVAAGVALLARKAAATWLAAAVSGRNHT